MPIHSSILAWRIPWTEKPGGLQSVGSQRVGLWLSDWANWSLAGQKKAPALNPFLPSISSVQSLSRVWLFATPWIAARQTSLSITNSWSSLRLTSIESVTPSSHLILCCPLLLLPPIPPSIRVFSSDIQLQIKHTHQHIFSMCKSLHWTENFSAKVMSHYQLVFWYPTVWCNNFPLYVISRDTRLLAIQCVFISQTYTQLKRAMIKNKNLGTSLAVQRLRLCTSNSGGTGLIRGQGTKIPYAAQHSQKLKSKTIPP